MANTKNEDDEGNEQLTVAGMNCIAAEKSDSIYYSICTKRNERREQLQGICFVFVNET